MSSKIFAPIVPGSTGGGRAVGLTVVGRAVGLGVAGLSVGFFEELAVGDDVSFFDGVSEGLFECIMIGLRVDASVTPG